MNRLLLVAALAATSSVAAAQATTITVTLSEWKIVLSADTVKAGPVAFRVNNKGGVTHMLYVRGEGVDKGTRDIPAKQSGTLSATLKPGTYEVFCPMSDDSHKVAGMQKTLVVIAASPTER
jgi:uncharacterized cupredoxin-like copper-binding protein